ncbi:MAG: hypothetical protein JXM79_08775 [Sedimentisphaerales bacterium]|nr:hypothetical protein [Sedimentisphaerales bacterium]
MRLAIALEANEEDMAYNSVTMEMEVGCSIGSGVVCFLVPALVVFVMFVARTFCIAVHEGSNGH